VDLVPNDTPDPALVADLRRKLAACRAERDEALAQQAASAEILQVINRSPGDLAPVFDAILEKATRIGEAKFGIVYRFEGDVFRVEAARDATPAFIEYLRHQPPRRDPKNALGRLLQAKQPIHIADIKAEPAYAEREPARVATVEIAGARTFLAMPMLKEDQLIGAICIYRQEVRPFTDMQIELARTLADHAAIAIENARLLGELSERTRDLQESLEYQTATSDVLKIISRSTFDLQPILDTLVETAARLCQADLASINNRDGEVYRVAASFDYSPELSAYARDFPMTPGSGTVTGRAALERQVVHVADLTADAEYAAPGWVTFGKVRTALGVPLLREGEPIGVIFLARRRVEPFTLRQIELVRTFADQAVIAIENARLLTELRERTNDLQESLEYQTATSDVLKVISRSTVDLQPILDTLMKTAARLCNADRGLITRRDREVFRLEASFGWPPDAAMRLERRSWARDRSSLVGRTALEGRVVHIPDVRADAAYAVPEVASLGGQSALSVPLLREGVVVGTLGLSREKVEPYTDRQIELVRTFADQAVIAIENTRLLDELHARTDELARREAELRVTFDNMGDGVAMFDIDLRLAAWNRNFQRMLDLPDAFLTERPSFAEYFRYLAERGEFGSADLEAELSRSVEDANREMRYERTRPDGRIMEVRRNAVPGGGFVLIYGDVTERKRSEEQLRAARDAAETALRELRTAQANLIHAEKMASLGQLTAGIAHEIKNPLNFVNNFASLSNELLAELKDAAAPAIEMLDDDKRAELGEVLGMLSGNLGKIAEHGRRADGIVKSMLAHSRGGSGGSGGSGDRQLVDLNALIEESLNLAYHGARAQDQNFNITLEREFDPAMRPIELVPQDITRVFLNLFGNGFYAANKRARGDGEGSFRPALHVATRDTGDAVEIKVRDNGIGIPSEIRGKLFQPFFTTKPTGEGTGLGLSISYDVVTQQHSGTITVDSQEGAFTEFTVRLPRAGQASQAKAST
jgi:two-component system, NtrC family, sensor kinase